MKWTPVLAVIVGTLGIVLITILGAFIFALVMGRYLRWKMQNMPSIRNQLPEVYEQSRDKIVIWQRRGCLFSLIWILPSILLIASENWICVPVVMILMIPFVLILSGLTAIETQYAWDSSLFRPLGLITGEQAVRHGRRLLAIGFALLLLFILCLLSTLTGIL